MISITGDINNDLIHFDFNRDLNSFNVQSKNKFNKNELKDSILNIHRAVNWNLKDDRISLMRLTQVENKSYFACRDTDKKIVGYVTIKPYEDDSWYVSFIAVDPEMQKQGCGKLLMNRVFKKAAKEGKNVVLDCQAPLVEFYKKIAPSQFTFDHYTDRKSYDDPTVDEHTCYYLFKA